MDFIAKVLNVPIQHQRVANDGAPKVLDELEIRLLAGISKQRIIIQTHGRQKLLIGLGYHHFGLLSKVTPTTKEAKVIEPPTRATLARGERLARRLLLNSKDQDVRRLAKSILDFAQQADAYAESLCPGFQIIEDEVRKNLCSVGLEKDGVWRLRSPDGKIRQTGATIKDLCINLILWDSAFADKVFMDEITQEEDLALEPNRRNLSRIDD